MDLSIQATPERLATAYHEAGHVVVHLSFGNPVTRVTISPADDGSVLGHVEHPSPIMLHLPSRNLARERRKVAREMILAAYAGIHAQRLVDPNPEPFHGGQDDEDALELSKEYGVWPRHGFVGDDAHLRYMERLRAESGRLVRRHEIAIGMLARELIRRETMTGDEALELVEPALV